VTNTATNGKSTFLADIPSEIRELLDWYEARKVRGSPGPKLTEFANRFLGGMIEDHAVIPPIAVLPAEVLALVLVHHQKSPENTAAWLNLGLALRRMALYQDHDADHKNRRLLQRALESFDRSLQLEPDNTGKNIRACIGKALTYHQMGLFDDEVRCCLQALDADRSDPSLWLFYAFALNAAGREAKALSVIEDAYQAYVKAGEPEGLRYLFADIVPGSPSVEVFRKRVL
jgi:tetratricopeptide (TPR) repeat protein